MRTPQALAAGRWKSPSVLAGILVAGVVLGIGVGLLGTSKGPGAALLGVVIVAVAVGVFARPLWACALVFAAVGLGNRALDDVAPGMQVIHVVCALALLAVAFALIAGTPADRLRRPEVRMPLLFASTLVLVAGISTALSVSPEKSIRMASTLAIGLLLAGAVLITARTGPSLRILLGVAVLGSVFVTVPALFGASQLSAVYGGSIVKHRPNGGAFTDPNELGSYAAMAALLAVGWLLAARSRVERITAGAGAAIAVAALAVSLSRGAWLGTVIGGAVLVAIHPKARRPAAWTALACVIAGLFTALVLPSAGIATVVLDRLNSVSDPGGNPYDVRPITWREAVREFEHAPVVGNGPASFSVLSGQSPSELQFYPRKHAHNGLLTIAAEMGSAGALSAIGLVVCLVVSVRGRARRLRDTGRWSELGALAGPAAALAALCGHLTVDYPLRNPTLMVVIWAVLGLLLAAVAMPVDRTSGDFSLYAGLPHQPESPPVLDLSGYPALLAPAGTYEIPTAANRDLPTAVIRSVEGP